MAEPDQKGKFVNTLLSPELLADLALIQRHSAIVNRSDAIRMLIREEARRIKAQEQGR